MKIKKGKTIWAILLITCLIVIIIGTIGALIVNGDFDAYNIIIIFLLIFGLSETIEKK